MGVGGGENKNPNSVELNQRNAGNTVINNRFTLLCTGYERSELQRGASRKHMQPGASCCAASGLGCACTRTTATMQPHMLASIMQTMLY